MEPRKLLVTCFEAFGGRTRNASQEVVTALPDAIGPFKIHHLCLPVVYGVAGRIVCSSIDELAPNVVVCVGEAANRKAVSVETVAVNLRRARIPDNAGGFPQDEPVLTGGPDRLPTTLPVATMVEAIVAADVPAQASASAGTFVCNDTLYLVLHHLLGTGVPAGFIHVPTTETLPCERIVAGLAEAIKALGDYLLLR